MNRKPLLRICPSAPLVICFILAFAQSAFGTGTLNLPLAGKLTTLDWHRAHQPSESQILVNVMEGLIRLDDDLQVEPALSTKWQSLGNGKVIRFTLRNDVRWSDGKPLKAQHFVDGWTRLLNKATRSPYAKLLFDIRNARTFHRGRKVRLGLRAIGLSVLEVTLERSSPQFLKSLALWPTFPYRKDLGRSHKANGKIVTLGPYQVQKTNLSSSIVLESSSTYYGAGDLESSRPDKINLKTADRSVAETEFLGGKIDILLQELKTPGTSRSKTFPHLATAYLGIRGNSSSAWLNEKAFREALLGALDLESIQESVIDKHRPATGLIPPGIRGSKWPKRKTLEQERLEALIKKAQRRTKRKPPTRLTLFVEPFAEQKKIRAWIKTTLKVRLGIEVGSASKNQADLKVVSTHAELPDPWTVLRDFTSGGNENYLKLRDKRFDAMVRSSRLQPDPKRRISLYAQAETWLTSQEYFVLPLFHLNQKIWLGPKVKSLSFSPLRQIIFGRTVLKDNG